MILNSNLIIYCDGASRGNPGPSAAAFVATQPCDTSKDSQGYQTIHQAGKYLGETTNNVAEYQAVLLALNWLNFLDPNPYPLTSIINLDSQLLYRQITGQYKIKAQHLKPLYQQIKQKLLHLQNKGVQVIFQHRLREHNALADQLANQILNQSATTPEI
jgi:ribonuclease HI